MIGTQLFEGENVRFTTIDPEKDGVLHSTWMHDREYASLIFPGTYRHVAPIEAKKQFDEMQKNATEKRNQYYFAICSKKDERLIGFFFIPFVEWSNAEAFIRLAIAEQEDLEKYGHEVLEMALRYFFTELNLYRVTIMLPEYSRPVIDLFERSGFVLEARLREHCYRSGRWWDMFDYGCVLEDWQKQHKEVRHE